MSKSLLLSLAAHVIGNPIIATGIGIKKTGTGLRVAGEYTEGVGMVVEAKGREIKAEYTDAAHNAKAVEEMEKASKAAAVNDDKVAKAAKKVAAAQREVEKAQAALAVACGESSQGGLQIHPGAVPA